MFFLCTHNNSSLWLPPSAYRFGQTTLVHVLVACAPLPASTGMVHGPRSAGDPVTVVAGVGRVVGSVGMVVVMVVSADERKRERNIINRYTPTLFSFFSVQQIIKQTCSERSRVGCALLNAGISNRISGRLSLFFPTQCCKSCRCAEK